MDTSSLTVHCDGGDGPLGHPRVFLDLSKAGQAYCPYCSRHFAQNPSTEEPHS